MKKIFSIIVLCLLMFTACKKQEEVNSYDKIISRDYIIAGIKQDAGPFGHLNSSGEPEGFDIDVAKYIAKKIMGSEKKIKFIKVTSNTRMEALTSGKVDIVVATMSNIKSRRYFVDFSIPYYVTGQTVAVMHDSDIISFYDLRNKTTLVVLGSTAEQNLRRVIPTADIIGYSNYKEAFQALKEGKGDAICTDDTIISGFITENPEYRALKGRLSAEYYSIGLQQTEDKILKENIDAIIKEMNSNGTLKSLKEKWKLI